jgi:hypothetical protein
MCTLVLGKVDEFLSLADPAQHGFHQRFAITNQGDDTAVVVGIHLAIEKIDAIHLHCFNDGIDLRFIAAFRKIGDTFYERWHDPTA